MNSISPIVSIFGTPCFIQFSEYRQNKTIAIEAIEEKTGESFLFCTVNYESNFEGHSYKKQCGFPAVVIKNYSENEGIVQELQNAGVIGKTGAWLSGSNGTVELRLLTDEWQEVCKAQLAANKKPKKVKVN